VPEHPSPDTPPETTSEDDLAMASAPGPVDAERTVVLVAGAGRSGTSLMAGILKHAGLHVPEPEVTADESNPKGFGEPRWVVDFHETLLKRVNVHPGDARPTAWYDTGKAGTREANRARLAQWLDEQLQAAPSLVVKDPRTAWFLGLWKAAAGRAGARTGTVTMLRPPTEVVASKNTYYGGRLGDITRLAGWTNVMLFTERATRGTPRSFVAYHDLLADWTREVSRVGSELRLDEITHTGLRSMQEIHRFVDPQLHRVKATWDDLVVPPSLREVAQEAWEQLHRLTDPALDTPDLHRTLDEVRRAYGDLYADAEALAASSIAAAGPAYLRANRPAPRPAEAPHQPRADRSTARDAYLRARRLGGRVRRRLARGSTP
jgi:hypothetical protein